MRLTFMTWTWLGIACVCLALFGIFCKLVAEPWQDPLDDVCIIFFAGDQPKSILINGMTYPLQEDGTLPIGTMVLMNPYHKEILFSNQCIRQDI